MDDGFIEVLGLSGAPNMVSVYQSFELERTLAMANVGFIRTELRHYY